MEEEGIGDSMESKGGTSTSSSGNTSSRRFRSVRMQPGNPSTSQCSHEAVMKDLCVECGQDLRKLKKEDHQVILESASISMIHSVPELKISVERAEQLGRQDEERLLQERKLVLLVDLDQTVIHTTNEEVPVDMPDVHHFKLFGGHSQWYHTKFRPGAIDFLNKMSDTYELHICTFGARMYAHKIAQLLDPTKKLFSHRILSRDECLDPHSKTGNLKALFPCGDSLVAIIDDREDVWNFSPNVICVKPYLYFKNTGDINSPYKPSEANVFQTVNVSVSSSSSTQSCPQNDSGACSSSSQNPSEVTGDTSSTAAAQEEEEVESTTKTKDASTTSDLVSSSLLSDDKDSTNSSSQDMTGSIVEESSPVPSVCLSESSTEESPSSTPVDSPRESTAVSSASLQDQPQNKPKDQTSVQQTHQEAESGHQEVKKDFVDSDDYLFYLEDILSKIHTAFYAEYDERMKYRDASEPMKIPDLKEIIPRVRKQVLKGVNIVFSGVVPRNYSFEKSKAYQTAKSLGANVCKEVIFENEGSPLERTTHVVAAKFGTVKVNKALKSPKKIWIVNPLWLFSCAERWERVDERVFLLQKDDDFQMQKKVKDPVVTSEAPSSSSSSHKNDNNLASDKDVVSSSSSSSSSSSRSNHHQSGHLPPEPGPSGQLMDYEDEEDEIQSGLMSTFTSSQLESMGKEVEEACSSDSSDSDINEVDEDDDDDIHELGTLPVNKRKREDSSEEDSLSCEAPRGWQERAPKKRAVPQSRNRDMEDIEVDGPDSNEEEETVESIDYGANLSDSSDDSSSSSSGSLDENMAADLVEREFLGD